MARFVALLRGINVGGKNLIKMTELAECLEQDGLSDVETYIASGNVLFSAVEKDLARLTTRVERCLKERFGLPLRVVVLSHAAMKNVVQKKPKGFGDDAKTYRYNVLFLRPPLSAKKVLPQVPLKEGVDEAIAGPGVIYHSRLEKKAAQSRLSRVVGLPVYQEMTIRNWNTTSRLLALMDREEG